MKGTRKGRGAGFLACLVALPLLVSASPASAVTIGQLAPAPNGECEGQFDVLQPTVSSGNPYVVPATGGVTSWTVTSWSTNAVTDPSQTMAMKIFRKVADPATFMVVGHEGPHSLVAGVNTFPVNLRVRAGDVLGAHFFGGGGACVFDAPGEELLLADLDLADGESGAFGSVFDQRLNAAADLTPTSDFTLGKLKKKPNGTAVLTVNVPNPGSLTVAGKGVKGSAAAIAAKQVAAGTAKLVIRAKGKKRAKLADTGKVTVKPKIRFTPTGGAASVESRKVKLRQK